MSEVEFLKSYFGSLKELISNESYLEDLINVKKILIETHKNGKKTMIFGNGGSAAIASHFSVDLTKNAGLRCTNYNESDLLTCFSNDFGYENLFVRQLESKINTNDILIAISTSGNSQNIINALNFVKKKKIKSFLLGGNSGGEAKKLASEALIIESSRTEFIQECHIMIGHCICYCVEEELFF